MLDGELTILDGKAYQTKANGETTVLKDDQMIAFSSVTFLNLIGFSYQYLYRPTFIVPDNSE